MSRHHPGQRRRSPSSSGVDVDVDGAVVSSSAVASTAAAASAALRVGYMYPPAAYLNFCPGGGIRYPRCPLDGTAEAATVTEAAAASASSDLEKKFRSHY